MPVERVRSDHVPAQDVSVERVPSAGANGNIISGDSIDNGNIGSDTGIAIEITVTNFKKKETNGINI